MTPERHALIRKVFLEAIAEPPEQRGAWVDRRCGADGELRTGVLRLLSHHMDASVGTADTVALPQGELAVDPQGESAGEPAAAVAEHFRAFTPGLMIAERYRIVAPLGRGGMGEVYRADDLTLHQTVALKFLPEQFARDAAWLARLHREVRLARTVTHPNVCRVFDIGVSDGDHFIGMEYVDGEDLASLLKRIGRLPHDKAVEMARQLCAGLAAAHAQGVLHRDLKPANIMLDGQGRVRITDFGLAQAATDNLGPADALAGTPQYMAPEQITGQTLSPQSDIYALGLVLYELFTGQQAFRGRTVGDFVRLKTKAEVEPPSRWIEDMDPVVEQVILRCLAKDPRNRPSSALAVAAALPGGDPLAMALAAGETPSPQLVAAAGESETEARTRPAVLLVAVLVLIGVCVALGGRGRFVLERGRFLAPQVLLHQARQVVAALDAAGPAVDASFSFGEAMRCSRQLLVSPVQITSW